MARYIDANSLHEKISAWPESVMYRDWVQSAIVDTPTVDAVEVVRCKDCEFYHKQDCELENPYKTKEDDFCSYGKMKEGKR